MARPRRTKVASASARVVTSSDNNPTLNTSILSKIDSMAPKKKTRGRLPKFKATQESDEIESSAGVKKKTVKRKITRKAVEEEVEDEQSSALDALRKKMDAGKKTRGSDPVVEEGLELSDALSEGMQTQRITSSKVRQRVASTPVLRHSFIQRGRTPSLQPNTDEDLYGLSPAGKAAQARLEARRSSIQHAPLSALKVQGTPGMETSIMALANFKRRPRQLSMIRMVQQTSELGPQDSELERALDLELDQTLQDFEDFMPENESTPLNFGKKKRDAGELRTSSSRKRKHDDIEDEIQIPRSSPVVASSPPRRSESPRSSRSESLPEERIIPSTEEQDPVNVNSLSQSSTMAPPRSSSEPESPKRQRTRGRPSKVTEPKTTNKGAKKAPKISTAHLQSLLPKARKKPMAKRRTAVSDVASDEEDTIFDIPDEDDDELSRPVGGRRRGTSILASKTPLRKADANKKMRKSPSKSLLATAKHKRTYGRQKSVGKENSIVLSEEEEDDTVEIISAKRAVGKIKELEKARKKFEEVDEWEMEFESVDLGGEGSSPWR